MRTFLIVDVNCLCWRAFHTTGQLSHEGSATGVAFGVMREIFSLIDLHSPERTILAVDSKTRSLRKEIEPTYKSSRGKDLTEEERLARASVREQIDRLKAKILPALGFRNIFRVAGYEADDIIAKTVVQAPEGVFCLIVSSDEDLFQCLSATTSQYSPTSKKTISYQSFKQEWGIEPSLWSGVKALAGCATDDVKGIPGVGPKTAVKWFTGGMKEGTAKYDLISQNLHVYNTNIPLVRLPFPGLELPEIIPDELTEKKRLEVEASLGFRSRRAGQKVQGFDL